MVNSLMVNSWIILVFFLFVLHFIAAFPQNNSTSESIFFPIRHPALKSSKLFKLTTTCGSCFAVAPAAFVAYEKNVVPTAINLAGSLISSTIYHCSDSLKIPIFGINRLRWHQLDNIFSISAVGSLFIHITCGPSAVHYAANVIHFLFNLYLQIRDPWNLRNTILPIGTTALGCGLSICRFGTWERWDQEWLLPIAALAPIAVLLFARGLKDDDFLGGRAWHSLWHVAAGGLCYSAVCLGLPLHQAADVSPRPQAKAQGP